MVNFSHSIATSAIDPEYWDTYLKQDSETIALKLKNLDPVVIDLLQKYLPVLKVMDEFYTILQNQNKNTAFPNLELLGLLKNIRRADS